MEESRYPLNPILIVDDEPYILQNFSGVLRANGIDNIFTCGEGRGVLEIMAHEEIEVLLLDLMMPHVSGHELLPQIRELYPDIPVIITTGSMEIATAVDCMKLGVFDYLVKAIEESKLVTTVIRAANLRELQRENLSLKNHLVRQQIEHPEALSDVIIADESMHSLYLYLESIAPSSQTVLITGETGVGKEIVAEALHKLSGRTGSFVSVNAAGLDENMFSDTLFGHVREAFTGAMHDRKGLINTAKNGTLFLDEIGDLNTKSQITLLRLLETREYFPLGSDLPERSDARIVVASNRDITEMVLDGTFRKDLYYRLRTHHVHVPPLRERPDEIGYLFDHFVMKASREYDREISKISPDVYSLLLNYSFPGNVRELRSIVYEAVSMDRGGEIRASDLKAILDENKMLESVHDASHFYIPVSGFPTLKSATNFLVEEALRRTGGNQARAAQMLGISPPALSRRLRNRRQCTEPSPYPESGTIPR